MAALPQSVVSAAQKSEAKWKIPASVQIAQYALESGWGAHDLGCFNYFGMKAPCDASGTPTVPFVMENTREVDKHGNSYHVNAPFRKFTTPDEAFDLHAKLLATAQVYAAARSCLPNVHSFVNTMATKYATDPHYAALIWEIITGSHNLRQYDVPADTSN